MGWGYKCFQWPLGRGAEDVDVGHREGQQQRPACREGRAEGRGFTGSWKGDTDSYYLNLEDEACGWMERRALWGGSCKFSRWRVFIFSAYGTE